jgi:tRNA (guanine37-N1)-methyltransferase
MKFSVLTIFPEMFPGPFEHSLAGKALKNNIWQLDVRDIRSYAEDKHQTVDDRPYGGGAGMVMKPNVIGKALDSIDNIGTPIYLSPRGELFSQNMAQKLVSTGNITILCGRYEGVDQRVIDAYNLKEVSMGDFILSGGEIAAYTVIDTCLRLIDGVIENPHALDEESFVGNNSDNLLEYPHYTRPSVWNGREVPSVLQSGNHAEIARWRKECSEEITKIRRPDMWNKYLNNKNNS